MPKRHIVSLLQAIVAVLILVPLLTACQSLSKYTGSWPSSKATELQKPPPRTVQFEIQQGSDIIGQLYVVAAREEDTLVDIARRYGLGFNEIQDANPGVDAWLPRAGTRIVLPTRHILPNAPRRGIVVNLANMRLFYFPKPVANQPAKVITYPIGIGRVNWQTPLGLTKVVQKVVSPAWYVPASIRAEHRANGDPLPPVVPPGPDNPLGGYALRLARSGYLIHGTNKPAGVGMRISHGCIRLFPEDIANLFPRIPEDTEVHIVNQPYLAGWHDDILHLETHKPLEEEQTAWADDQLGPMRVVVQQMAAEFGELAPPILRDRADALAIQAMGIPAPISRGTPSLAAIVDATPFYLTPSKPEPQTPVANPNSFSDRWYVQAGSFRVAKNANKLAMMLKQMGPPIPAQYVEANGLHRVIAGPFGSQQEAREQAERIEHQLGASGIIIAP